MTNDISAPYNPGASRVDSNKDKTDSANNPRDQKANQSGKEDGQNANQNSDLGKVTDQALTKFSDITKSAGKYVKEKPLVVAGIALAIGYLLGSRRK